MQNYDHTEEESRVMSRFRLALAKAIDDMIETVGPQTASHALYDASEWILSAARSNDEYYQKFLEEQQGAISDWINEGIQKGERA